MIFFSQHGITQGVFPEINIVLINKKPKSERGYEPMPEYYLEVSPQLNEPLYLAFPEAIRSF